MITFETIRKLASDFPGAEEGISYGTPAIKLGKKLILRLHQEEDAIVVLLDSVEDQQLLIERDPDHFFITDHYVGKAAVLVSTAIDEAGFRNVLEQAWRRVARKKDLAEFERLSSARGDRNRS